MPDPIARPASPNDAAPARLAPERLPAPDAVVTGTSADRRIVSVNPTTGEILGAVPSSGPDGIDRAMAAATAAQKLWRGTSFAERRARLHRLADRIHERALEIADLIALEQGKPRTEALALEVLPALDHLRFVADHAERITTGERIGRRHPLFAHKGAQYLFDPVGVVAIFAPFNLPFARPLSQAAAALAMGNAAVLKPSEQTPFCGDRISRLVGQAGFPEGVVSVVQADPDDSMFLAAHPGASKLFLTGTRRTAQTVLAGASWLIRPIVLALGGKHPAVVAADADLDRAARGIVWGALANCGQNCGAVERVYVEQSVAARFVERVVAEVDRVRVGDPRDPRTDLGPLVSDSRRREVHAQVQEAIAAGAHRMRGGTIPEGGGFFYPPTVLLGAPPGCRLMREETLGPVIPIVVVDNIEQAILLANDADLALTASGWTTSPTTAERLVGALQAGVVTINDLLYSFGEPAATWSGFKGSGAGHVHGIAGLREMTTQKFVSLDGFPAEAPLFAYPYDDAVQRIAADALEAMHGSGGWRRARAVLRLAGSRRFRSRVPLRSFLPAWKRRSG